MNFNYASYNLYDSVETIINYVFVCLNMKKETFHYVHSQLCLDYTVIYIMPFLKGYWCV